MAVRLAHSLFGLSAGGGSTSGLTPAVILHGLFGSGNNWKTIASRLASETNRLVYTVDARNHGETQHTPEMNYDLMSRDTLKFIQDQGLDKVILIGHSMGGKTAMATALSHPDVIEGLVVVDVTPDKAPGERGSTGLIRAMKNLDLSSLSNRREADEVLKNDVKDFLLRQFLLTNLIGNGSSFAQGQSLRWKVNLDTIESSILTLKRFPKFETTYNQPALFVGGGNSKYITPTDVPGIKQLFPLATIKHIPGAGHWAHVDKPAEFLQLIREFLSNCDNKTDSVRAHGQL